MLFSFGVLLILCGLAVMAFGLFLFYAWLPILYGLFGLDIGLLLEVCSRLSLALSGWRAASRDDRPHETPSLRPSCDWWAESSGCSRGNCTMTARVCPAKTRTPRMVVGGLRRNDR
jgi:hypothetical protein